LVRTVNQLKTIRPERRRLHTTLATHLIHGSAVLAVFRFQFPFQSNRSRLPNRSSRIRRPRLLVRRAPEWSCLRRRPRSSNNSLHNDSDANPTSVCWAHSERTRFLIVSIRFPPAIVFPFF